MSEINPAVVDINFELTPKQALMFRTLDDPAVEEVLYGGAKGGAKTWGGCCWVYYRAKMIIKQFALRPTKYPLVVGFMGRKQAIDFNTTTLNTWKRVIDERAYEIKEQKKLIVIENTVAIQFGGLDDTDTIRKFNSAEYAFYFIDQSEECSETDIGLLRGTLRLKIKDQELPYKGLLTANPAICWLKPAFITNPQKGTRFIQALPSDNPKLPSSYVERLRKAFTFKPELLKAYLEGSWDDLDSANIIIPNKHVLWNVNNTQHDRRIIKKVTVADISSEGNNETVIYDGENTKIVDQEIYSHHSLMDTTGRLQSHAKKNGSNMICVDKVGEGKGVYDRLVEIFAGDPNMEIYGFDGRIQANDPETFVNYKAEAWWNAGKDFFEKRCDIPNDYILISQLSSVPYYFRSNEKIAVIPKEKLRELLKGSPDRAEAYVMLLDALKRARPVSVKDAYGNDKDDDDGDDDLPGNSETC